MVQHKVKVSLNALLKIETTDNLHRLIGCFSSCEMLVATPVFLFHVIQLLRQDLIKAWGIPDVKIGDRNRIEHVAERFLVSDSKQILDPNTVIPKGANRLTLTWEIGFYSVWQKSDIISLDRCFIVKFCILAKPVCDIA